jgi:hypothetical protein
MVLLPQSVTDNLMEKEMVVEGEVTQWRECLRKEWN